MQMVRRAVETQRGGERNWMFVRTRGRGKKGTEEGVFLPRVEQNCPNKDIFRNKLRYVISDTSLYRHWSDSPGPAG